MGKLEETSGGMDERTVVEVQCFPLVSFLIALNVTTVDYFSLDVEGAEFAVLRTIPWEKVDIKVRYVIFVLEVGFCYYFVHFLKKDVGIEVCIGKNGNTKTAVEEAVTEWSAYRSGEYGVLCLSPVGGTGFSSVAEWSSHPHFAQLPYLYSMGQTLNCS